MDPVVVRDIRPDLKERLEALAAEREEHKRALARVDEREAVVKGLLAEEEERWEKVQPALFENGDSGNHRREAQLVVGRTPLARFLVGALGDGRPHRLAEIVRLATDTHFDFGTKNPGRSIHFALIGLQENDFVRRLEDGTWQWRIGGHKQTAQRS